MLNMFLICAAVVTVLSVLVIKLKKSRKVPAVLAVLALLPTAVTGMIALGVGDVINYPGNPSAAVLDMTNAVREQDFKIADVYVLGTLGFTSEETDTVPAFFPSINAVGKLTGKRNDSGRTQFQSTIPSTLRARRNCTVSRFSLGSSVQNTVTNR